MLPDSEAYSQQTLLEARSHVTAKSIVITAAAVEGHGGHSQLASWMLFSAAGTVYSSRTAAISHGTEDQRDIEARGYPLLSEIEFF